MPKLYFPLSNDEIQHFTMRLSNAYYNNVMKTDNINVINDCFEKSLPNVILPKAKYELKRRARETESGESPGKTESKSIILELEFQSLPLTIPTTGELAEGILYQTSAYFKGVDFLAIKNNVFGLGEDEGKYLIAFQVTAQKTAPRKKLESTIRIPQKYRDNKKGVLLILVSFYFPDFEENYLTFNEVTSSRSTTANITFQDWWFGHLCDFEPLHAMYISIKNSMYTGEK